MAESQKASTLINPAFAEAEKLVQFPLTSAERQTAAGNWRKMMAPLYERRTGPRKYAPPAEVAPIPQLAGRYFVPATNPFAGKFKVPVIVSPAFKT